MKAKKRGTGPRLRRKPKKGDNKVTPSMRRVLRECLFAGGEVMLEQFGKTKIRYKGVQNIVTRADINSQTVILDKISKAFPEHDYMAEENEMKFTGAPYSWILDPLDGTTNYAHGFPICCVSIALLYHNKPVLGGIYDPFRDELYHAELGKGATLNGRKIKVSEVERLSNSLLVTGFPYDRRKKADFYAKFITEFMRRCHGIRRSGSAALDMAWVACGRLDGFWEFRLNPWDVAAGKLIVEEAGGRVTGFANDPWGDVKSFGQQTLATNGRLHREMASLLHRILRLTH